MKRVMTVIKYAFALGGIAMLVIALLFYRSTSAFVAQAVTADGEVVDLVRSRSGDSSSRAIAPTVHNAA